MPFKGDIFITSNGFLNRFFSRANVVALVNGGQINFINLVTSYCAFHGSHLAFCLKSKLFRRKINLEINLASENARFRLLRFSVYAIMLIAAGLR